MPAANGARPSAASGYGADIAPVAALLADPARAAMLGALIGGSALAAGELSQVAGISPATASAHLARLLDGGLVTMTRQGRHRYYRLPCERLLLTAACCASVACRDGLD